ncbi:MAG: S24 family peptidase [Candidatus Staskawiczbacteria bacterium]|jgi:repressor LexA
MHIIQRKILNFLQKAKVTHIGLSQLGRIVEKKHPQQIKHHLEQLKKNGFISWNSDTGAIKVLEPIKIISSKLLMLPIFGAASCGPAEMVAKESLEGYLKISSSVLGDINTKGLFIVRASGNSLDKAEDIKGGPIEDGDYVVIDPKKKNFNNGDYVLSVIDEHANLKRFYKEEDHVMLVSESTSEIPPIYIHPDDFPNYMINGVIVRVFKKPKPK